MKEMDELGGYSYMTVGELKEAIKDVSDDTEVYIRTCHNPTGNVCHAGIANQSEVAFFGEGIPTIIIEPAYPGYIIDQRVRDERTSKLQ